MEIRIDQIFYQSNYKFDIIYLSYNSSQLKVKENMKFSKRLNHSVILGERCHTINDGNTHLGRNAPMKRSVILNNEKISFCKDILS